MDTNCTPLKRGACSTDEQYNMGPSIQRDFMRAFHASRLVTEGTSAPTRPKEDGRGACRRFAVQRERERDEEQKGVRKDKSSGSDRLMTKATGTKQCTPRHFCPLFCLVPEHRFAPDARRRKPTRHEKRASQRRKCAREPSLSTDPTPPLA